MKVVRYEHMSDEGISNGNNESRREPIPPPIEPPIQLSAAEAHALEYRAGREKEISDLDKQIAAIDAKTKVLEATLKKQEEFKKSLKDEKLVAAASLAEDSVDEELAGLYAQRKTLVEEKEKKRMSLLN